MFGLTGTAAEYAYSIPGVVLVLVFAWLFMTMNKKNSQEAAKREEIIQSNQEKMQANQERMQEKSYQYVKDIQETAIATTVKNMENNTLLTAKTLSQELLVGISPLMTNQQLETEKNTESIKNLNNTFSKFENTIVLGMKDVCEKNQRNFDATNLNIERINNNVKTFETNTNTSISNLTGSVKHVEGRLTAVEVFMASLGSKKSQSPQNLNLTGDLNLTEK